MPVKRKNTKKRHIKLNKKNKFYANAIEFSEKKRRMKIWCASVAKKNPLQSSAIFLKDEKNKVSANLYIEINRKKETTKRNAKGKKFHRFDEIELVIYVDL